MEEKREKGRKPTTGSKYDTTYSSMIEYSKMV